MGLFQGNMDSKAPFIIQITKGARSYTHKRMLEGHDPRRRRDLPRRHLRRAPGPRRREDLLRTASTAASTAR